MNRSIAFTLLIVVLVLLGLNTLFFQVDQRNIAIVIQFGQINKVVTEPGLHVKTPFIEDVVYVDKRILTIDSPGTDSFLTSEKKNLVVDWYAKWRITDAGKYWRSFRAIETRAANRLLQIVKKALQEEIAQREVSEVLSTGRQRMLDEVMGKVIPEAQKEGLELIDVRLKRVDFDSSITNNVFERMRTERRQVANEQRGTGAAEAERIRSDANKRREVMLAEAYRKAQEIRGKGDSDSAKIYADAFGNDAEFAQFYRSMQAYKNSFAQGNNLILLDPKNNEFLRNFGNPPSTRK